MTQVSGSMRRVCLFGVGIVACLTFASCGNGQNSTLSTGLRATSAAEFVHRTMGLPSGSYPSFWTDASNGAFVSTGKVAIEGSCAAVDFDSPGGPETAFVRHDGSKWVPEKIISEAVNSRALSPPPKAAPDCI